MKISLRHRYIEIYVFFTLMILSVTNTLLQQLLFKNICERDYGMKLLDCKNDPIINDIVQKMMATYTAKLSSFTFYIGPAIPILVSFILISYKTTLIMILQLVNYTIIGLLMISYNLIQSFSPDALIYSVGFLLALCSISGLIVITLEYINTLSKPSHRTLRFAILFVSINSGMIVGQLCFGFIIQSLGFSYAIIIYIALVLIATITYTTMIDFSELPVNDSQLLMNTEPRLSYWATVKKCYYELKEFPRKDKISIIFLFLANSFYFFIIYGQANLNVIFLLNKEIKASSLEIGVYNALLSGIPSLSVMTILPLIKRFLPMIPDFAIAIVTEFVSSAHIITFGLVASKANIFKILPLTIFNNFVSTISLSRTSRFFSEKQRILFYGVDNAISSALGTLGSILLLRVYNTTVSTFPGMVYVIIGSLRIVSAGLIIVYIYFSTDRINRAETAVFSADILERQNSL